MVNELPEYMVDRFNKLRGLSDGWFNGEGIAPTDKTIDFVMARTLELLNRFIGLQWYVFPSSAGGIELSYAFIEIEVHPDADGNFVWMGMGGLDVQDLEPTTKFEDVVDWIGGM